MRTDTLSDRVWLAYWSLPREKRGRPATYRRLEVEGGLPNGIISKLVMGDRQSAAPDTIAVLADVLKVDPAWLAWGKGEPPTPTGTVPPRTLEASAAVEESGEAVPELAAVVSPHVQEIVRNAVEAALLEAPAEAGPLEVLSAALMHVSRSTSRK